MTTASFDSLTEAQRAAVLHLQGPLLILAGPGSGKTRVITHRIAHMIDQGIHPRSILALTFTNKAADEMSRRVERLTSTDSVWISTFHRFCSRLLRRYADHVGLSPNFTIYDTSDSLRALKQAIEGTDVKLSITTPEQIARQISATKNSLITHDQYQAPSGSEMGTILREVYPAYQKQLLKSNAVDFDDLLVHVASMLRQSDELRRDLDESYQYIMVDEYQDTNLAQYAIVRALSIDHPNLAVTGDPDQSIYGWRGANLQNILGFERDYPEVNVVRLEQNYRSTPNILRVADALISNNVKRKPKDLFTENEDGAPVRLVSYPTQKEEADEIIASIVNQIQEGRRRPKDFAIFFRVNALSRAFEHALRDMGLAYQIVNGVEFYQRKEIKDMLAYLHLINNPQDDVAVQRIINVPARRIGKTTFQRLSDFAHLQGLSLLDAARQCAAIESISKSIRPRVLDFVRVIDRISAHPDQPVTDLLECILSETKYLQPLQKSEAPEDHDRLANIEELLTAASEFDTAFHDVSPLEAFLEQASLVNDTDAWSEQTDRITLMTLHAAKGLEFPVVFIAAVEQNLLPHERSMASEDQLEEERRLLFVGITRAEEELQLSCARFRSYRGSMTRCVPSCFLMELPRDEMKFVDVGEFAPSMHPNDMDANEHDYCNEFIDIEPDEDAEIIQTTDDHRAMDTTIQTAADMVIDGELHRDATTDEAHQEPANIDPDHFRVGMTVVHPEYGPGKIKSLSGRGVKRTGIINFPTAGQKNFVLAFSGIQPIG
ncbi:MAG: UvrD-helicase domain-containing protein [Pirellulaceae bacterium]|nr:UvrD-helicase domain-containing protein [Pirellulaceae bacterium]